MHRFELKSAFIKDLKYSHKGANEAFCSNIKKLQQQRIGAPSCGWTGEGGTLLPITQPHEGVEESRDGGAIYRNNFLDFFRCYVNMLKYFYNLYQYKVTVSGPKNWM